MISMPISSEVSTGLLTLGGAIVGAIPGLVSSFLSRRTDEKKQLRELVIKAATESWKTHAEHAGDRAMLPLEHYIIHTMKMCEFALSGANVTPDSLKTHLKEVSALMDILLEHASTPRGKKTD
jgi:gas vesicle protein